jgi:hypothetical protein
MALSHLLKACQVAIALLSVRELTDVFVINLSRKASLYFEPMEKITGQRHWLNCMAIPGKQAC